MVRNPRSVERVSFLGICRTEAAAQMPSKKPRGKSSFRISINRNFAPGAFLWARSRRFLLRSIPNTSSFAREKYFASLPGPQPTSRILLPGTLAIKKSKKSWIGSKDAFILK
jgi:hypothetical protein